MRYLRLATLATVVFLLAGCSYLFPPEEELLAPPLIEPEEITYRTMEVANGLIEDKLEVYASFSPSLTASVAFEGQGGRVSQIAVKLGQTVEAGDLLIELDSESLKRQIRQQEIEVHKAQLALDNAKRVETKDETYDLTGIAKAKINLELEREALEKLNYEAEKAYRRVDTVEVQEDLKRQVERQELVVKRAELEVLSLVDAYEQWQKDQQTDKDAEDRQARIRQAELDLLKQQNALGDLNGDLKNAQLYAPIGGTVSYVMAGMEIGQNVEGYTTLFRVSDPTETKLTYSGDDAHSFSMGMKVTVSIKGKDYAATVASDPTTMPTVDGKVVSEVVFVLDEEPEEKISSGESAKIAAVLRREEDTIVLPKNCINSFWGRKFVNLLEDGIKVERDVQTGIETATKVQIVQGLSVGETVIMP